MNLDKIACVEQVNYWHIRGIKEAICIHRNEYILPLSRPQPGHARWGGPGKLNTCETEAEVPSDLFWWSPLKKDETVKSTNLNYIINTISILTLPLSLSLI